MKSGNINFIDTELTNEQFASLGYPALYILKNSSNIVTKFIIFDLNGVRTDYDTSSGGGTGVTEEWVNEQISTAIVGLQDNRLEFNEFSDFPAIGDETKFYIDLTEDKIYIWDAYSQTYKNQSWDTATIAFLQASIASAQMAFQNLQNSKLDKGNYTGTASDLVPYNGALQDVNIASNYFKTSKGFNFTYDENNYFKIDHSNSYNNLIFYSEDSSNDNFGYMFIEASPEIGFVVNIANGDGIYNSFHATAYRTYSEKPFVSSEGFIKTGGTANQALTANGGVFDLNTKADLVDGKVPSSQLPSNKTTFTYDILVSNWTLVSGKYEAVISNAGILSNSFVDVIPSNDQVDIVRSAQIYPSVLISEGSVKVYSKFLPSGTISVTININ